MTSRVGFPGIIIAIALAGALVSCQRLDHGNTVHGRHVEAGVIDLSGINLSDSGPFSLAGTWEFVYGEHVPTAEVGGAEWDARAVFITLPSTWKGQRFHGEELPGDGIATYRLRIVTDGHQRPTLLIPGWETAYRLFINGREVASAGITGTAGAGTAGAGTAGAGTAGADPVPAWHPRIVPVEMLAADGVYEIVFHISNFHHARGGPAMVPALGSLEAVRMYRERGIAQKMLAFGSLVMIAFYHLMIFLLRRKERSALYFALFCFALAVRTLSTDEQILVLLLPALPWGPHIRITYLAFATAVSFFTLFIQSLYPREVHPYVARALIAVGFVYAAIIVVTPPLFFTAPLVAFQVIVIVTAVYCIVALGIAAVRRREGSWLFLLAFLVYFISIVNDILYHRNVVCTGYLAPLGFVVFIAFQAVVLARRYAFAFIRLAALFQEKTKLESAAITLQSLSYLDALTGVANRRRLDEYLDQEWHRAVRDGSIVSCVMIDIDFFKRYNDSFGHLAGDEALKAVAGAIQACAHRPADLVARYGGEEFALLLPGTDRSGALALCVRIRHQVQKLAIPAADRSVSPFLTISLGCASGKPGVGEEPSVLIRHADLALYAAKTRGRDRIEAAPDS